GSSLGGVINIITKEPANARRPSGTVTGSYGEKNSQDYSADISGKIGSAGYYLYAGHQASDGLRDERFFHNNSLYAKIRLPLTEDVKLGFTFGYSEPKQKFLYSPAFDITSEGDLSTLFTTLSLDAVITPALTFNMDFHTFRQKFTQTNHVFGSGIFGPAGDLFSENTYKERTTGGTAKLVWKHDIQTAVLGADISQGDLDQTLNFGPALQSWGLPAALTSTPDVDRWAVFLNDTVTLGGFSVTPGIRYDHNSVSGNFTSPSLGMTYKAGERTLLRASAARGFTMPPLGFSSAGGLFLDPNPLLKPERVWSYQAGVESGVTDHLWVKATLFYHDMKDAIVKKPFAGGPPAFNDLFVNEGNIKRRGIELEAETVPFYNVSLKTGFVYLKKKLSQDDEEMDNYVYNLLLKYDDRRSFLAQLFG
ncbi:MAG: TonB-dependent receptor, partial [Syntrophales bacterium]|nr:TonB-dependent receptor [Syntrophales bacterium]